jgi:hypothetical protein
VNWTSTTECGFPRSGRRGCSARPRTGGAAGSDRSGGAPPRRPGPVFVPGWR